MPCIILVIVEGEGPATRLELARGARIGGFEIGDEHVVFGRRARGAIVYYVLGE